jgi:hypothetical protein
MLGAHRRSFAAAQDDRAEEGRLTGDVDRLSGDNEKQLRILPLRVRMTAREGIRNGRVTGCSATGSYCFSNVPVRIQLAACGRRRKLTLGRTLGYCASPQNLCKKVSPGKATEGLHGSKKMAGAEFSSF